MSEYALRLIEENKKTKAKFLDLGNCGLSRVPEELFELEWLEKLNFGWDYWDSRSQKVISTLNNGGKNRIDRLPEEFAKLQNLKTLILSGKEGFLKRWYLNDLSPLTYLTSIEHLEICSTRVENLEPLSLMDNLKILNLSHTRVNDLRYLLPLIRKGVPVTYSANEIGICVANCGLRYPPHEIVLQGNQSIINYYEELANQGEDFLYEAKIVIVGAGGSGKTTLIKKILNPDYSVPNINDTRTQGIQVTKYPFVGKSKDCETNLNAHIWDFGGQEIYHTTHQFFLTADTLYILLNDNRKNDTDFYYWLNIVTLRAGYKCPILMVFNAKDNTPRQIMPSEELFKAFENLLPDVIDINFADVDNSAIILMRKRIESHFSQLEVIGKSFPAFWVSVREEIGKLLSEHITWTRFIEICNRHGITNKNQRQVLIQTLHNLGILLYFPNVFGLEDLIVLQSQWCIDAIYIALDTPEIIKNSGRFDETLLKSKWSNDRFKNHQLQLLKLMQHFDLCYTVDGTRDYIAPQLLPIEEHRYPEFPIKGSIVYRFDYKFMPSGLLTRLIARLSRYIKAPYVWRTGVTLEWEEGTIAEIIENQFSRQIVMRVSGPERKRRLAEIRKTLHSLHQLFRGLKFEELVACNCADCTNSINATTFELRSLEDDALHNDEVKCTNGTRKKIYAHQILDGVEYIDKPRIFVSYSHRNKIMKDEFRKMIQPLEREGQWKVWDDCWLLPGDNWNQEITRHLSEANIIVLLLTPDFFNSDYIYDIEMSRAIQRHESMDALVVGVVVSDCLWEETPLRKIQIVPEDGLPIERHPHRNEVWKAVANKIKEAIAVREKRQVGHEIW